MKAYKMFSILFTSLLFASVSNAKIWKVSTVEDIKAALNKCAPGDELVMTTGTWKDANIVFRAKGTKEKPITLRAETTGSVLLTGNSKINILGSNLVVSGLYFNNIAVDQGAIVHFDGASENCRFTNSAIVNDQAFGKQDIKWILLEGINNRVDHSYFRNKTSKGPLLYVIVADHPNYHLIDSNYFGYRAPQGFNGAEIMRIGLGHDVEQKSITTVAYNYFEDCNGETEIISSKSSGNIFRYNTFRRCQGTLCLRQGNDNIVEGNYFIGEGVPKTGGVKLFGENHKIINNYFSGLKGKNLNSALVFMNGSNLRLRSNFDLYRQVKNVTIENNTFVDNDENVVIGVNYGDENKRNLPPDSVAFNNNVFYKSKEDVVKYQSQPKNIKWNKNIIYAAKAGVDDPEGFENVDPKLQQSSNGIWQATQASPEIAKAKSNAGTAAVSTMRTASEFKVPSSPITGTEVGPTFLSNLLRNK